MSTGSISCSCASRSREGYSKKPSPAAIRFTQGQPCTPNSLLAMSRNLLWGCGLLLLIRVLGACGSPPPEADLVLINGKIITVDSLRPDAQALAVSGDRIAAVGSSEEIGRWIGAETKVIDLEGRPAVPGFIEGHGHFLGLGESQRILDLSDVRSWEELTEKVRNAANGAVQGAWIQGRGWHQEKWDRLPADLVDGVPTHQGLSAASPENPVLLVHASGHSALANALALREAGISRDTPNPPGGEIVRDRQGEPTGLLRESAQAAVHGALARSREHLTRDDVEAELRDQVRLASAACLANGVTSFHDAGVSFDEIEFFRGLAERGDLPVRLYVMVGGYDTEELDRRLAAHRIIGAANNHLTVRSIKLMADGALGAHGAWMLEPYEDLPMSDGLALTDPDEIEARAEIALRHGFQVNTHAIGDRANREVLDRYERIFLRHLDKTDLRWRIEHAQHLHPDDIGRFAALGVVAAMQGIHCTSDAPWVIRRLGADRARTGAYVWRSLWDSGAVVTNGTDTPVENISPIASYYATVARRMNDGTPFFPEQRLNRLEALRSYTLNNAYAAFEEDLKGSLIAGKLADIVVLSDDLLTIPEERIPDVKVDYTIVGGQILFARDKLDR